MRDHPTDLLVLLTAAAVIAACSSFGRAEPEPGGPGAVTPRNDAGELPVRFCSSPEAADALFCDDFDVDGLSAWTKADSDGQTIYAVDDDHVSPPHSAHLEIGPGPGGSQDARLRWAFPDGTYSRVTVSGRIKLVRVGTKLGAQILALGLPSGNLVLSADGRISEKHPLPDGGAAPPTPHLEARALPSLLWQSLRLDVDLATRTVKLALGEAPEETFVLDGDGLPVGRPWLSIGPAEAEDKTSGWIVLYDDVVVRAN